MPVNLGPWTSRPTVADWPGSAAGKSGPGFRYPAGPDPLASLLSAGTMRELLSARIANRVGTGLPIVKAPQPVPVDTLSLSGAAQARIVDARPVASQEAAVRTAARSPAPAGDAGEAYRELGRRADILRAWQAVGGSPFDRGREARVATPGSVGPTGVAGGTGTPSPGASSGGPAMGPESSGAAGAGSPPTGQASAGSPAVESGSESSGSTTNGGGTSGGVAGSGAATGEAGSNGSTAGSSSSGAPSGSGSSTGGAGGSGGGTGEVGSSGSTAGSGSTGSTSGSGTGGSSSGSSSGSGGLLGLLFRR